MRLEDLAARGYGISGPLHVDTLGTSLAQSFKARTRPGDEIFGVHYHPHPRLGWSGWVLASDVIIIGTAIHTLS